MSANTLSDITSVSNQPDFGIQAPSNSSQAEIEQKLNKTLHNIDMARISLSLLRQRNVQVRESLIQIFNDSQLIISNARDPDTGKFLLVKLDEEGYLILKSEFEGRIVQLDAELKTMADNHNGWIRRQLNKAERFRLEIRSRSEERTAKMAKS